MKPLLVRKQDFYGWTVRCRGCAANENWDPRKVHLYVAVDGAAQLDWGSQQAAFDGALDHARREHWTPEVAK